ncbi:MAG TPA: hypothetical protein VKV73_01560 [Chloroflexota bacterium]|nr:hypothetical protein [Chloroflexota bacterium]
MSGTADRVDPQRVALFLRVLGGDLGAAQAWFDQRVLDRYRAQAGWRVMRTNTVGRVKSPAGWSLDFGIGEGDAVVHTSLVDLTQRLPASERQHWAQHLITPAVSRAFLTMRLAPGSCIDDGELRDWAPEADTKGKEEVLD